jgi:hypothetical protein
MPSLTDGAIRRALKHVEKSRKEKILSDGEGRGTGRLVLVLKSMPTRVTAEWMAQQWRDGHRTKSKLGSYPSLSLSQARAIFQRDFADVILKRRSIKIAGDARPGTVADLFAAYVTSLKETGKPSWLMSNTSSTEWRAHSGALGRRATSSPEMCSASSVQSMNAVDDHWLITCEATFGRPTLGPRSPSTTIAVCRPGGLSSFTTPPPGFPPSRRL